MWNMKFLTKSSCPPPSYARNLPIAQFFGTRKCSLGMSLFGTVRQNYSKEKRDNPHLLSITFCPHRKNFGIQKGTLTKLFELEKQKMFDKTRCPLLCMKTFDARCFLKQRRVPLRVLSTLWDKSVSTENIDICSLCKKFFDNRIFLKLWMVPPQKNSSTVRRKNFRKFQQKLVMSPFYS